MAETGSELRSCSAVSMADQNVMGQKNKCGILGWAERINDPRATAAEGRRRATTAHHPNVPKRGKKKKKTEGVGLGGLQR